MKKIQDLVDKIDDELKGAQEYAEEAIIYKAKGNNQWSSKYRTMAEQELNHAITIHDRAIEEIEQIKTVYEAPAEMEKKWEECHKLYVDKAARIRVMLTM